MAAKNFNQFVESVVASMCDENGHCGERGLSVKQFRLMENFMSADEWEDDGFWSGKYKEVWFQKRIWSGQIGAYDVVVQERQHFNVGYSVVEISRRPEDEIKAEAEEEKKREEMRDFSASEWVGEPKKRMDFTVTLVSDYEYYGRSYSYYDDGLRHIYTMRDENGNCIVWKTTSVISWEDENGDWIDAEEGDTIIMKATVKEHGEYRGNKQTIVNRPKINGIKKA